MALRVKGFGDSQDPRVRVGSKVGPAHFSGKGQIIILQIFMGHTFFVATT